jgi:hypothetical protein
MRIRTWFLTAAVSAALCPFARADVTGNVQLKGKAPEMPEINMKGVPECNNLHADPVHEETVVVDDKGNLANVVVMIKSDEAAALGGAVPSEPAVLDQKGCQYVPHVLPVMVGQKLLIKNDDPFLHNVHSLAQTNPGFNFGQPNKDPGKEAESPKTAENIKVKCDVHPWMGAWIIAVDHPFFGTSGEDGNFTIKNVPDGEYTFVAWHEKYGTSEQKATVKDGKTEKPLAFEFKSESAMAEPADTKVRTAQGDASATDTKAGAAKMPGCCSAGGTSASASADAKK